MAGQHPLWVAQQLGHSPETMFRVYTAWNAGAVPSDLKPIRRALRIRPDEANGSMP
jgi:hypothetical protein